MSNSKIYKLFFTSDICKIVGIIKLVIFMKQGQRRTGGHRATNNSAHFWVALHSKIAQRYEPIILCRLVATLFP